MISLLKDALKFPRNPMLSNHLPYTTIKDTSTIKDFKNSAYLFHIFLVISSLVILTFFYDRNISSTALVSFASSTENSLQRPAYLQANQCPKSTFQCCANPSVPVLGGMDVVQMSLQGNPEQPSWGLEEYQHSLKTAHGTYKFYFQSQNNLEKFELDPWKYVPSIGGFATDLFAQVTSPDKLKELELGSNIQSWVVQDSHIYFTSGNRDFSDQELVAIETKASKTWGALFKAGDAVFNTQCLSGFEEEKKTETASKSPAVTMVKGSDGQMHMMVTVNGVQLEAKKDKDGKLTMMKPTFTIPSTSPEATKAAPTTNTPPASATSAQGSKVPSQQMVKGPDGQMHMIVTVNGVQLEAKKDKDGKLTMIKPTFPIPTPTSENSKASVPSTEVQENTQPSQTSKSPAVSMVKGPDGQIHMMVTVNGVQLEAKKG